MGLLSQENIRWELTKNNSFGKVRERIDQLGYQESFLYDEEGNLILHTDRDGRQVQRLYNMFGNPVYEKSTNADRKNPCISTWRYDSLGRMIYAVCDGLLKRILEKRMLKHINNMRKKIGVKDAEEKMSEIKEFDLLKYLKDDGIYLENVSLQNYRLTSSGAYSLFFRKCICELPIV